MIKDFKLNSSNRSQLVDAIYKLDDNKIYRVNIVGWRDRRNLSQSSLSWVWYGEITKFLKRELNQDWETEDIHDYFCELYCPEKVKRVGKMEIKRKKTSWLDKGEMCHYLTQIQLHCAERFGLVLESTGEYRDLIEVQNGRS